MKEETASLPRHVVYCLKGLSALGRTKLGVVAWGNGSRRTTPEQPLHCSRLPTSEFGRAPTLQAMKISGV